MNVFALITNQHTTDYTLYTLESFYRHTPLGPQDIVYLIDNDGAYPADAPQYPKLKLLRNRSFLSFSANFNQSMRIAEKSRADLFFLNNDLILTPQWLEPLLVQDQAVLSPVSNGQLQYQLGDLACPPAMDLPQYVGREALLVDMVRQHRERSQGFLAQHIIFYFCIKIPYSVYSVIGPMDEGFGACGGEDCDYCVRCHLAGIPVAYALPSYVLHFQGKSTWRGAEDKIIRAEREKKYRTAFAGKWGKSTLDVVIDRQMDVIKREPNLWAEFERGNFQPVFQYLTAGAPGNKTA